MDATISENARRPHQAIAESAYGPIKKPPACASLLPVMIPRRNMVQTGTKRGIRKRKKQSRIFLKTPPTVASFATPSMDELVKNSPFIAICPHEKMLSHCVQF